MPVGPDPVNGLLYLSLLWYRDELKFRQGQIAELEARVEKVRARVCMCVHAYVHASG